jgi:cytochrome c oxidase subunit 1
MKARTVAILALLLVALASTTTYEARPGGIGKQGDGGCSCHGGMESNTVITVDGLPSTFNASEEYLFTLTITNDDVEISDDGAHGGFRIIPSGGVLESVPDINGNVANDMEGGLTHSLDTNDRRTWEFKWTAPSDDTDIANFIIYGNAVNGNGAADTDGSDQWNKLEISVPGLNANPSAPSAAALTILMTAIGLALGLILVGSMWVFYTRNPDTFSIGSFWAYLKPWLTTTDHKMVGILYFLYGFFFFLVGGLLALLFRIQLALPENDFLTQAEYNSFFTLHGTTMIFLAAMPMIAGFMNYILPLQIGAKDLAFPRINALGFWIIVAAAPLIFTGVWSGEAADITWVMYPPYSSLTGQAGGPNPGTIAFISGIALLGASSTLSGVNFVTTTFTMRAKGVGWMRMPLFTWSVLISVFMLYVSLPAFVIGIFFLLFDSTIGTTFFTAGGDPLLFQHLFWFFGHPEVYVVVVPAFGIVSEVLATSARRSIFGYRSMVYAMVGIGVVGFIVWGHHMLTSGMSPAWRAGFMITTMAVAIPTGCEDFQLARYSLGRKFGIQDSHSMVSRIPNHVYTRRIIWNVLPSCRT